MGRIRAFQKKNTSPETQVRHLAVIMDGNGRWARKRGLPRLAGHQKGVEAVRALVEACPDFGIKYVTLFAFSSENWRRPADEVKGLMSLFRRYVRDESKDLERRGARLLFMGTVQRSMRIFSNPWLMLRPAPRLMTG